MVDKLQNIACQFKKIAKFLQNYMKMLLLLQKRVIFCKKPENFYHFIKNALSLKNAKYCTFIEKVFQVLDF